MANQNPYKKEEKAYREFMPPIEKDFGKLHVIVHSVIPVVVTDEQFKEYLVKRIEKLIMNAADRDMRGMQ